VSTHGTTWPWQRLNQGNANAHEVLATLVEPQPGERWLDVGTGGGGLAFLLAAAGASTVGVDIAEDGLEHARAAAAERGLDVEFVHADAQELPFEDAEFDGVTSAFGVIFAPDQERAAAELARVCRPGGKLGLTLMPMDSRTGSLFALLERYGREGAHPATWEQRVESLLGDAFDLEVEPRESPEPAVHRHTWEEATAGFSPLREVAERLDEERVAELRREFEAILARYEAKLPTYVVVVGRRR
jgi:ubiquinone/menaquinone biosynthesis C-methylase UbiE